MAMFNFDFSPQAQLQAELTKVRLENEKVKLEAYRRSKNAEAVVEGKAMALRDSLTQTARDIESADMDLQRTQRQWFEAKQRGSLSAEQNDLYRNAYANAQANAEMQKSKYRVLTMEKGHLDGTLDKTVAEASKPMFGRIFDPKKDPYDQIVEERKKKVEDGKTGETTEVTQKGPASAFVGNSDYAPQGEEDTYSAPPTATSLLGFTPRGFDADPEAVTPEFSARSMAMEPSSYSKPEDGDPMSAQPNPAPVQSMLTNASAPAPEQGGVVRVRNKATGQTGSMPIQNANRAVASGQYEIIQ